MGVLVNASITPEQRERMRVAAEESEKRALIAREKMAADTKKEAAAEAVRPKPNLANYNRLQIGMTYQEVVSIVGPPSQQLSESEGAVMYMWQEGWIGGNMNATFVDGKLYTKAQLNLQ